MMMMRRRRRGGGGKRVIEDLECFFFLIFLTINGLLFYDMFITLGFFCDVGIFFKGVLLNMGK